MLSHITHWNMKCLVINNQVSLLNQQSGGTGNTILAALDTKHIRDQCAGIFSSIHVTVMYILLCSQPLYLIPLLLLLHMLVMATSIHILILANK